MMCGFRVVTVCPSQTVVVVVMENIRSLEGEIKKKLENAFDVRHIYEIFSTLVTTITEQNEEIESVRQELRDTKSFCQDLANRVKTMEFNIQGFDANDAQIARQELKILDIVDIDMDPSKGFVKRVTTATPEKRKPESLPPTARKRTESKGEKIESKSLDVSDSRRSSGRGSHSRSASPAASRKSSHSTPLDNKNLSDQKESKETLPIGTTDPNDAVSTKEKPTSTATIESQKFTIKMTDNESLTSPLQLPEDSQQTPLSPEIVPPPLETPLTHRLSDICRISARRTPEEEIAWKAKKRNILRRMYAKMTFLINVTNATHISRKFSHSCSQTHILCSDKLNGSKDDYQSSYS
jgi:hypothetical protein